MAVTAGSCFGAGGAGYIRFSYAVALEQIQEGLERLEQYVRENKK